MFGNSGYTSMSMGECASSLGGATNGIASERPEPFWARLVAIVERRNLGGWRGRAYR